MMKRLRADPPGRLAGEPVTIEDLAEVRGGMRTDAVIFDGPSIRVVVRPSGTEPKLKCYLEVVVPVANRGDLATAHEAAKARLAELRTFALSL